MTSKQPLAGVRVVDFTQHAAGPLASKFLADQGAEVILVESEAYITTGGGSRQSGPPGMSPINTAWFHNKMNPAKLSITVNMNREEGRGIVKRLLAVSDVMIANVRPAALEKLDLTYATVSAANPRIIFITMPTMGAGGPRSFYGGVSWGIQAMAGLNAISGFRDRPPVSPSPFSHPDVSCNPIHAMVAILAALRHRRKTGRGQMIELAQYESSIAWTGPSLLQYTANGTLMAQPENSSPDAAPHDVFRCQGEDRWCAIAVSSDDQWRALCEVIGRPELADDPAYATLSARKAHEEEFKGIVEPWTTQHPPSEVMQRLQTAGVPCGTVDDAEMLLRGDPQLKHRQYFREVEHPELGSAVVEGWGVRLSKVTPAPAVRAPLLGENNDYVFQQVLEMSEDEVNMYIVDEVLR